LSLYVKLFPSNKLLKCNRSCMAFRRASHTAHGWCIRKGTLYHCHFLLSRLISQTASGRSVWRLVVTCRLQPRTIWIFHVQLLHLVPLLLQFLDLRAGTLYPHPWNHHYCNLNSSGYNWRRLLSDCYKTF